MTAAVIVSATYQQVRGAANWGTGTAAYNDFVAAIGTALNSHAVDIDSINTTIASGIDLTNTSVSSVLIGTGTKNFILATSKAYQLNQWLIVTDASTPGNWMLGQVTGWNAGTKALTLSVSNISGSGTIANWTVQYSSPPDQTVNINGLSEFTGKLAYNDMIVFYDASASANKKYSKKNFEKYIRTIAEL